jgi:hypothetical protein
MSRGDHQDQRNAASCIKVDGGHQKQQKKHADAKQDEEQEHAVGIIAKSESLAHINRRVTRFYDEDAHISEDKSELNRDHECAVHVPANKNKKAWTRVVGGRANAAVTLSCWRTSMLSPLKWLDAHLQCKEGCADKQCHQDARLIGFLSDQQHEADDCGQGWGRIVDLVSSGLAEAKQGVCGWGSAIIQRSWDRDGAARVSLRHISNGSHNNAT